MGDQGDRKTVRAFQCRDYLYQVFDSMSSDMDCSVDYLINEAMREYARAREYAVANLNAQPAVQQVAAPEQRIPTSLPPAQPQPEGRGGRVFSPAPPPPPSAPPPLPGQRLSQGPRQALFLVFNGQRIPVDKEEFIIGRGARAADLAIRDGNISRRHAAIVFHDGGYFMKDLGSTNGIEYAGRRVESKRIEEGDVFRVCDYELRFTFQ